MSRTRIVILLIAAATAIVLAQRPASAHEGEGAIAVESQQDSPDQTTSYVVRVTWQNDGHPAADATVTATAVDPAGTPQTPVVLAAMDQDGRYGGTVSFPAPGSWTVRFSVVAPTATSEVTREVTAPTTTSTTSTTAAPTSTSSTNDPDDGGGSNVKTALAVGALVLVGGAIIAGFARSTGRFTR